MHVQRMRKMIWVLYTAESLSKMFGKTGSKILDLIYDHDLTD